MFPIHIVESNDQMNDNGSMIEREENEEKEKDDQNEENLNIFSMNEIEAICKEAESDDLVNYKLLNWM